MLFMSDRTINVMIIMCGLHFKVKFTSGAVLFANGLYESFHLQTVHICKRGVTDAILGRGEVGVPRTHIQ